MDSLPPTSAADLVEVRDHHDMRRLVRDKAMQLDDHYHCRVAGGTARALQLFNKSHWSDYARDCVVKKDGHLTRIWCRYADATRMLAAHRNPALRRELNSRERRALDVAEQRVQALLQPEMGDLEKVRAIHDDLVKRTRFRLAAGGDAAAVLLEGEGLCEAYARAALLLCRLAGAPCRLVCGMAKRRHVWNMVQVNGQWYHMDVSKDDPSPLAGSKEVHYRYFCRTDEEMARTHHWKRDGLPSTPSSPLFWRLERNRAVAGLQPML